jgi:hypothetical protein
MTLRIILERPPKEVDFGLQRGRGAIYETFQAQHSTGEDLHFELTLEPSNLISPDPASTDPAPAASSTSTSCWTRRLKIPLNTIPAEMFRPDAILEARIAGTGKDGAPNCGTSRPIDGWKLQN